MDKKKVILPVAAVGGSLVILSSSPVMAQSSNGITEMTAAVNSLVTIKDAAIPIAVSIIAFGCGALVLKRLLYS